MEIFEQFELLKGITIVALGFLSVTLLVIAAMVFHVYGCLQKEDISLARARTSTLVPDVVDILKRGILWVVGYKGEAREKTPFRDVDVDWINRFKFSIISRLFPVYSIYILSLVVLTRPVYFRDGAFHAYGYSDNIYNLFFLLIIYVCSNVIFDYISIKYTLSHIIKAKNTGKYYIYLLKDLSVSTALFFSSQAVSCILWYLKRESLGYFLPGKNYLTDFFTVTFWPYAFVNGQDGDLIVSPLFPGQLLITGTVYFPTIILSCLFIIFVSSVRLIREGKKILLAWNLEKYCKTCLHIPITAMFSNERNVDRLNYCNTVFTFIVFSAVMGLFNATISAFVARAFAAS